jgi:hypothetical protein
MQVNEQPQIWDQDEGSEEVHQMVVSKGRTLYDHDGSERRAMADDALVLYHASGRYSFTGSNVLTDTVANIDPVGSNVIRECVDTKINHIVRNKVRPYFLTENGDSELKEKALGMQRCVEAVFDGAGLYGERGVQVARHGYLFDGAGIHISPDYEGHCIDVDLVWAWEIQVDPVEAERGDPRQMWRKRRVPRERLLARYPEHEDIIRAAKLDNTDRHTDSQTISDSVEVWDYWHLPSGYVKDPSSTDHDGKHVVCVEGATLLEESYPFSYFPIPTFRPYRTAVGFWSVGIPERLAASQEILNKCNQRIDEIIRTHAVPTLLVDRGAKIKLSKWSNAVAKILEVDGSPSQAAYYMVPQSVPSELFKRCEDIRRQCREEVGLSEMSMYARKPAGVDHAPGMQELMDTESIRHTVDFREWEDFFTQAARVVVDSLRMLAEHDPKYELAFRDSKQLRRIKWKDVDLEASKYHLGVWPTNLLSQSPSRRKSEAMDFYNAELWTKEQVMLALDYPDTQSISGDQTAESENIERMLAECIEGKDVTPEPYMNLVLAKTMIVKRINRMQADKESEEKIDRMRDLFLATEAMIARLMPPAPMGPPPGMAGPPGSGGVPMAPPMPGPVAVPGPATAPVAA